MKILLVTEYFPETSRAEITGGVEAYCHYLALHLGEQHEVEVIARPSDGSVWDDASLRSIPGRLWFTIRALARAIRAPADVIMGTTYVVQPVAWLAAKLRRRPIVFWYPDVLIGTWTGGGFGRVTGLVGELVERVLMRLPVDRFIAISHTTAAKLRAHGVAADRISVIPCGFERRLIDEAVPEPGGDRIVVVGRLVPYKRVDVVIRAFALVAESHPSLHLVIVGQGPEADDLRSLVDELAIRDRVEFRGFVPRHTDVLSVIAGSRALVSASEIEGFGIVVAEAMALGVPYVASDIPAFREVTGGGRGGRLFTPGRPTELATALDEVLSMSSESLVTSASDAAAQSADYEWSTITDRTAGVLTDVVTRAHSGRTSRRGWLLRRHR